MLWRKCNDFLSLVSQPKLVVFKSLVLIVLKDNILFYKTTYLQIKFMVFKNKMLFFNTFNNYKLDGGIINYKPLCIIYRNSLLLQCWQSFFL